MLVKQWNEINKIWQHTPCFYCFPVVLGECVCAMTTIGLIVCVCVCVSVRVCVCESERECMLQVVISQTADFFYFMKLLSVCAWFYTYSITKAHQIESDDMVVVVFFFTCMKVSSHYDEYLSICV